MIKYYDMSAITNQVKDMTMIDVKNILNDNLDVLKNDIASMDSVQRVNALLQVAKYILPTLKAVEVDIEQTNNDDTLRKLMSFSESDYDRLEENG